MKKLLLCFFAFVVWFNIKAQTNDAVTAYIDQYKQLAIDEMIRTGVPASITLAQGILESNAGQCPLVAASNNHFGIKCKNDWTGDIVYHDDDVKHECFRRYSSAEDSYRDHSDFLKTHANYASLFDLDVTDYSDWAYGLKKAGYATNPVYAQSIIRTIEDYDLEQYTDLALLQGNQVDIAASPVKMNEALAFVNPENIAAKTKAQEQVVTSSAYPQGVFTINETKVIYAKAGTSLLAIASNYNISYNKLLQFNEFDKVDILRQPSLVYLAKKPKKGSKSFHVVTVNEKMQDIAQKEGVQLGSILAYNNFQKDSKPKPGDKILLRSDNRKLFRL